MGRPWEKSIAVMPSAYSDCAVTCWTHGRAQKMPPAKSSSSCSAPSRATTVRYRSPGGCYGWLATNALTPCGGVTAGGGRLSKLKTEPPPLGAVISMEERAKVRDTIARLPENYRVPLVLRYYSELSYEEIAQQLDLERNYVAALIFRAKKELRRRLPHRSK